jgi:spermidine synthase
MERLFSRLRQDGWSIGGLYAANTFGAVAGTIAATWLIVPVLGFRLTLIVLAAANVICAVGVLAGAARHEAQRPPVAVPMDGAPSGAPLLTTLFVTGLLGIGYEVLIVRVLSQVLENTVYTFASVLAVYLFGTALGAALYQVYAPRQRYRLVLTYLLQSLATACLIGVLVLWSSQSIYSSIRTHLGGDFAGSVVGELGLAYAIFLLPTLLMGATFSHLAQASRDRYGFGRALGVNTLGAALAPLLFGVLLLPLLGSKIALVLLSLAYLLLVPKLGWQQRWMPATVPLLAGLVLLLLPAQLRFITARQMRSS